MMRDRNKLTPNTLPSPVVVRDDTRDVEQRKQQLATDLAVVIEIMDRTGVTAAGFKVTSPKEIELEASSDKVAADKLLSARATIRAAADKTIGLFALPNAMLVLPAEPGSIGHAVTLLGDDQVCQPLEYRANGYIRLISEPGPTQQ